MRKFLLLIIIVFLAGCKTSSNRVFTRYGLFQHGRQDKFLPGQATGTLSFTITAASRILFRTMGDRRRRDVPALYTEKQAGGRMPHRRFPKARRTILGACGNKAGEHSEQRCGLYADLQGQIRQRIYLRKRRLRSTTPKRQGLQSRPSHDVQILEWTLDGQTLA